MSMAATTQWFFLHSFPSFTQAGTWLPPWSDRAEEHDWGLAVQSHLCDCLFMLESSRGSAQKDLVWWKYLTSGWPMIHNGNGILTDIYSVQLLSPESSTWKILCGIQGQNQMLHKHKMVAMGHFSSLILPTSLQICSRSVWEIPGWMGGNVSPPYCWYKHLH